METVWCQELEHSKARIFLLVDLPSYCNFLLSRKKKENLISKLIFYILSADS